MENALPFSLDESKKIGTVIIATRFFEEAAVMTVISDYLQSHYMQLRPIKNGDVELTVEAKDRSILSLDFLKEIMNNIIDRQAQLEALKEFREVRDRIVQYTFNIDKKNV